MNIIAEVRRRHFVSRESISSIARSLGGIPPHGQEAFTDRS